MVAVANPAPQYDSDGSRRLRTLNWLDSPLSGPARRRRLQNGMHLYRSDSGLYYPTSLGLEAPASLPYGWQGNWDMKWAQLGTPMQAVISDAVSDAANGCLWGMRLSWRPDLWVNWKLLGTNAGVTPQPNLAERWATWPNVLSGPGHLRVDANPRNVAKVVRFDGQPTEWPRFSIRQGPGCTFEVVDESYIRFLAPDGSEYMRTAPAYGWWGAASPENATGVGRVRLVRVSASVVRAVPVAAEWASATFPIYLDPTTSITDTGAIEDTIINDSSSANANFGANTGSGPGAVGRRNTAVDKRSGLFRLVNPATDIPAGTVDRFEVFFYQPSWSQTVADSNAQFYAVKDANTWVEGTGNGSPEVGSSCWNKLVYNTTDWAGSAGCRTSGTDYDADASPPSVAVGVTYANSWRQCQLTTQWAEDWRDAARTNNGCVSIGDDEVTAGTAILSNSTEAGSNTPYIEIDYTEPAASAAYYYSMLLRHRRN